MLPELHLACSGLSDEQESVAVRSLEGTIAERVTLVSDLHYNLLTGVDTIVDHLADRELDGPMLVIQGRFQFPTLGRMLQFVGTLTFLGIIPIFGVEENQASDADLELVYWNPALDGAGRHIQYSQLKMWRTESRHSWILFLPLWPFSAAFNALRESPLEKVERELPGGVAHLIALRKEAREATD